MSKKGQREKFVLDIACNEWIDPDDTLTEDLPDDCLVECVSDFIAEIGCSKEQAVFGEVRNERDPDRCSVCGSMLINDFSIIVETNGGETVANAPVCYDCRRSLATCNTCVFFVYTEGMSYDGECRYTNDDRYRKLCDFCSTYEQRYALTSEDLKGLLSDDGVMK